jgi:hypothetical protein
VTSPVKAFAGYPRWLHTLLLTLMHTSNHG